MLQRVWLIALVAACLGHGAARAAEPNELTRDFTAQIKPLLVKHCNKCHHAGMKEGGVDLATPLEDPLKAQRLWKRAVKRIAKGEMPPEGEKPLEKAEHEKLLAWLNQAGDYLDCDPRRLDPGPASLRRLTRVEYANTVRDLFNIRFDAARAVGLPEDGNAEGFDNIAAALTLSPALLEKYFAAADKIVEHLFTDANAKRALLGNKPGNGASARDAARALIEKVARRAYRRPLQPEDATRLLAFYDRAIKQGGSFEDGVQAMLKPVLVSPRFLFRIEEDRPGKNVGTPVDDHELAVRLSYFLWSSMPDDALFAAAEQGKLSDPAVFEQQVKRLLADRRAASLTESFAVQWLQLDKLATARPSREHFPAFSNELRDAMRQETMAFFENLRTEERSVLDLLDADYTFVNEVLARHYGIDGVKGPKLQRVPLRPDHQRGGLLGMASVLTLTSHTFRTSPTQRGKYVLEVVFGTPPPPPPPNAGTIKDDNPNKKEVKTFREQLAQHATQTACAGCHRKIDPLGFALDNYDAIGGWRESTKERPLDTSGVLPTGEKLTGAADLKKVLKQRQDEFARNLAEQMLTYALGRELDHYDECAVRAIVARMKANDYRFSSLVLGLVETVPFRQRRVPAMD